MSVGFLARDSADEAKTALRGHQSGAGGLTGEQRSDAGRLLRDAVLCLPEAQMAGTVAAYYSVGTEPSTRGLVYALWKRGTYVILPLLRSDGHLDWAPYEGPESMTPAGQGLLEPAQTARALDRERGSGDRARAGRRPPRE